MAKRQNNYIDNNKLINEYNKRIQTVLHIRQRYAELSRVHIELCAYLRRALDAKSPQMGVRGPGKTFIEVALITQTLEKRVYRQLCKYAAWQHRILYWCHLFEKALDRKGGWDVTF